MTICCFPNCAYLSETSRMVAIYKELLELGEEPLMATHGGTYVHILEEEGIPFYHIEPTMSHQRSLEFVAANRSDEGFKGPVFYTTNELRDYVNFELVFFKEKEIDVVLTGFSLSAAISTRALRIPLAVTHLGSWVPIIFEKNMGVPITSLSVHPLLSLIPEQWLARIHNYFMPRIKFIKPFNIVARELKIKPFKGFLDLLLGDLTLVTDVPEILGISAYEMENWRPESPGLYSRRPQMRYVGAIYAELFGEIPQEVKSFFETSKPKVYVALTSSRLEYVKAVYAILEEIDARILLVTTVHKEDEDSFKESPHIMIESHLPSHEIMPLVDCAVIHGGQGSVQTAVASGTPIIGFPLQPEQRFNVKTIERHGAGLGLPLKAMKDKRLKVALERILGDETFKKNMLYLKEYQDAYHGPKRAAEILQTYSPVGSNRSK